MFRVPLQGLQSRQSPYPRDEADDDDNCHERLSLMF